ncbi:MAG: hypothetical protein RRY23_08400 [Alistipes sp.]
MLVLTTSSTHQRIGYIATTLQGTAVGPKTNRPSPPTSPHYRTVTNAQATSEQVQIGR